MKPVEKDYSKQTCVSKTFPMSHRSCSVFFLLPNIDAVLKSHLSLPTSLIVFFFFFFTPNMEVYTFI